MCNNIKCIPKISKTKSYYNQVMKQRTDLSSIYKICEMDALNMTENHIDVNHIELL